MKGLFSQEEIEDIQRESYYNGYKEAEEKAETKFTDEDIFYNFHTSKWKPIDNNGDLPFGALFVYCEHCNKVAEEATMYCPHCGYMMEL